MKMLIPLVAALAVTTAVVAGDNAYSPDNCETDISLKYGVSVNPDGVRVFDEDRTLYTMADEGRLWIEGNEVDLTETQRRQIADYAAEVSKLIPEIVNLISGALGVAGSSLGIAFGEIFGHDSAISVEMESLMDSVQARFDDVAYRDGDTYTLAEDNVNGIDEAFGEEIEQELEDLVARSVGSILGMVGKAMTSGEGSFAERMERFGMQMENLGDKLEQDMENMGAHLEAASAEVCMDVRHVASLEQGLRQEIPELESYELFTPEHIRSR